MRLRWIALSAVPSSLLLGVTAYISTNIAPIPLFWVVPLALYLLTFILAFKNKPLVTSKPLGRLAGMLIPCLMVAVVMEAFMPVLTFVHLTVFFVAAWMCHAKLSESRPAPRHLTEFYFWLSVGGVLGGAFNALLAPVIFTTLFEYTVALILAVFLMPPYRPEEAPNKRDWIYPLAVTLLTVGIIVLVKFILQVPPSQVRTGIAVGIPAILCYFAVDRPFRFGLSLAGMVLVANGLGIAADARVVLSERSFFGVHRVVEFGDGDRYHMLLHGNTQHGEQDKLDPRLPLTYYYPTGPIGQVFRTFSGPGPQDAANPSQGQPASDPVADAAAIVSPKGRTQKVKNAVFPRKDNVALVGLGVGSLAAYGQPGQNMTFYEIDPTVRNLATNPRLFTFVHDSRANVKIVLGDGRLELAKAPAGTYGLIVLDAFSSDSIPVHLLTREAGQMYLSKLAPGGIIAYHISNRYLDLSLVVGALARDLGLAAYIQTDGASKEEEAKGKKSSIWMVVARSKADLDPLLQSHNWDDVELTPSNKAWTDDFSNVLGVLKGDD